MALAPAAKLTAQVVIPRDDSDLGRGRGGVRETIPQHPPQHLV